MGMAGFAKPRLERMHRVLNGYVERGDLPGLVALVSHHDGVHVEALGTLAFGNPAPMKQDAIFRVASITKLITAVAAMILTLPSTCLPKKSNACLGSISSIIKPTSWILLTTPHTVPGGLSRPPNRAAAG